MKSLVIVVIAAAFSCIQSAHIRDGSSRWIAPSWPPPLNIPEMTYPPDSAEEVPETTTISEEEHTTFMPQTTVEEELQTTTEFILPTATFPVLETTNFPPQTPTEEAEDEEELTTISYPSLTTAFPEATWPTWPTNRGPIQISNNNVGDVRLIRVLLNVNAANNINQRLTNGVIIASS